MASTAVRKIIDDPANFHLLTTDMKEMLIKGGIATVNVQAALARKNAIENVRNDFTLRNNFTTSQIQFQQMEKKRLISLSHIQSKVGVTERAGYMARQETGGLRKTDSGKNLTIATNRARGGNKGSPVMKSNYFSKLMNKAVVADFHHGDSRGGGRRLGKFVAAAYIAAKNKLPLYYNGGLFQVNNFEKKYRNNVSFKMDLLYNLKHKTTITPKNEWLLPASLKPAAGVENIYISQMRKLGM